MTILKNCCNTIQQQQPQLAKFGRDYIKNGADIKRSLKKPTHEQPPYPINNKLFQELAAQKLIALHAEGKIKGPFHHIKGSAAIFKSYGFY